MGTDDTILSLQPGDHLGGRYELVRILGRGGMGVVWLALDLRLDGRPVAIKVLRAALSTDKRAVARLKEEANRNLELTHPHIVRLHTFDQDPTRQDVAFLVMQYIEGQTLNDLLADHPKGMPIEMIGPWFERVAQAIDYAHERGILHRDIKPGNIIIEAKTNAAYLMDFGIGREARDTMTRVTGVQDSSGTLPYMSPQQLMGKNDKSNDVYSFAATLYEALAGLPPFHTGDIAYQVRHAEPEEITSVSSSLNEALRCGLAKEPGARPASCRILLHRPATPTPAKPSSPRHLTRRTVEFTPGVTAEFVYIDAPGVAPDGFLMGSPAEEPYRLENEKQHSVKLTQGFWMQTTEITQSQWKAVMGSNPSYFKNGANHPVEHVSWDDCQVFIEKMRHRGIAVRLPTEAEWEFSCRAGTTTPFNTGRMISTMLANYNGGNYAESVLAPYGVCRRCTTPVTEFAPNEWGLYDMHGNVSEWCHDHYDYEHLDRNASAQSSREGDDGLRVLRGGHWDNPVIHCRSAFRIPGNRDSRIGFSGFRLALDPE